MLSVEQWSSTGHEFVMGFLVVTICAGIYRLWNEIQMIAKFLILFCSVTSHIKRIKKVLELWALKDFTSMVPTEGTFWRSPVYVNHNLLGTVNTGWVFFVIIALYILTSICSKVLIIKINFLPTLRWKGATCSLHRENPGEQNGIRTIFFSLLLCFFLPECLRFSRPALNVQLVDH